MSSADRVNKSRSASNTTIIRGIAKDSRSGGR